MLCGAVGPVNFHTPAAPLRQRHRLKHRSRTDVDHPLIWSFRPSPLYLMRVRRRPQLGLQNGSPPSLKQHHLVA
jgi:hypothetical protein